MGGSIAIIGTGQIGYACAQAFGLNGWHVTILARNRPDWMIEGVAHQPHDVKSDPAPSADVILDTIAFDAEDIARYDPDKIGRLIVVSSASVYCDARGRTLDEAAQNGFPEFDGSITEDQSTVAPGPATYSTRKVRMENAAHEVFGDRATILRPCAIHGPWSRHPREWWFVKRVLDGRTRFPLAFGGASQFQTTSTRTIGLAALATGEMGVGGTFNLADDDSPTVAKIGHAIAQALGKQADISAFDSSPKGTVGRTPWSIPHPIKVSGALAAEVLGVHSLPYSFAIDPAADWLRDHNPENWRITFPQLAAYPWDLFDYDAEDAYFRTLD